MFEEFTRGYYLGRMYVEPHDAPGPVMHDEDYHELRRSLYDDADLPLVFKLGNHHLPVEGDESVPSMTLGLPDEVAESVELERPPQLENVLLAKRDAAAWILEQLGRVRGT
ncbi:MAG: DUF5802 family protein [Halobacteriales archaeon]